MAASASLRMKGSEEIFDYACSLCLTKKNKVNEAAKYCHECQKYLCTSCLEHHNYYMEGHDLVEPSAACGIVVLPTERCKQHGGELVKLWCKQHDEVLCSTCVTINHRLCEEVKFIPSEIDTLLKDSELQQTKEKLNETCEQLTTLKNKRSLTKQELLKEKKKYLDMVDDFQRRLIQKVQSLGGATRYQINAWYEENVSMIDANQNCCDELEDDTSNCLQKLETSAENKPQLFVSMKKGQKLLTTTTERIGQKEIKSGSGDLLEINGKVEECLDGFESLGSLKKQSKLYKATDIKKINVRTDQDSEVCYIFDSCVLSDGSVLVTDNNNTSLKLLDSSSFTVKKSLVLAVAPRGVCCVGNQEVVVCLGDSKIQFVSVDNTMTLTSSISVGHNCCGIACNGSELFVSDANRSVYVYSLTGSRLKKISKNPSGKAMFSRSNMLDTSGDNIYVTDDVNGAICLKGENTEIFRYKSPRISSLSGICVDGNGGVFLCNRNSDIVVQLGPDGKKLGVVLAKADGLKSPLSVSFNKNELKLIVSSNFSDEILVASLTYKY